jgi:hypothetical protein
MEDLDNITQLASIITEIRSNMDQYTNWINSFNNLLITNKLGATINSAGTIMIDAPSSMSDEILHNFKNRVRVLDGVIKQREGDIKSLLDQAIELKSKIKNSTTSTTPSVTTINNINNINSLSAKFTEFKNKYPF